MVKRCTAVSLLLLALTPFAHALPANRVVSDSSVSADNEGQHEFSQYFGYVEALPQWGKTASLGVRAGYWQMSDNTDVVHFDAVRLDHQRTLGPVDVSVNAQQLLGSNWSPALGGVDTTWHVTSRWNVAASANAEIVDTATAALRHTRFDTGVLSTDFQPVDEVTLVTGALRQSFSDGNVRRGELARAIYSPAQLAGFSAQLRLRRLDAAFQGVGYFSPDRFEEGLLVLKYAHAVAGDRFVLTGLAGVGQQLIDAASTSSAYQVEVAARGWVTDHLGLEGKAGCTNVGELRASPDVNGYRYCYAELSLAAAW